MSSNIAKNWTIALLVVMLLACAGLSLAGGGLWYLRSSSEETVISTAEYSVFEACMRLADAGIVDTSTITTTGCSVEPTTVISEVEVIKEVEVIREVSVEVIREVEVISEVEKLVYVPAQVELEVNTQVNIGGDTVTATEVATETTVADSDSMIIVAPVADAAPVVETVEQVAEVSGVIATTDMPRLKNPFVTPVAATSVFNAESAWIIAEPGVTNDDETAWTIPGTKEVWYSDVPEAAFAYYSCGGCTITLDGVSIVNEFKEGRNYITIIRGSIDDNIVDRDLNGTSELTAFKPGHLIFSYMPVGAYVSKNWLLQQLQASGQITDASKSYTNCGSLGCSEIIIKLYDRDTHFYQVFSVKATDLMAWTLLGQN